MLDCCCCCRALCSTCTVHVLQWLQVRACTTRYWPGSENRVHLMAVGLSASFRRPHAAALSSLARANALRVRPDGLAVRPHRSLRILSARASFTIIAHVFRKHVLKTDRDRCGDGAILCAAPIHLSAAVSHLDCAFAGHLMCARAGTTSTSSRYMSTRPGPDRRRQLLQHVDCQLRRHSCRELLSAGEQWHLLVAALC